MSLGTRLCLVHAPGTYKSYNIYCNRDLSYKIQFPLKSLHQTLLSLPICWFQVWSMTVLVVLIFVAWSLQYIISMYIMYISPWFKRSQHIKPSLPVPHIYFVYPFGARPSTPTMLSKMLKEFCGKFNTIQLFDVWFLTRWLHLEQLMISSEKMQVFGC